MHKIPQTSHSIFFQPSLIEAPRMIHSLLVLWAGMLGAAFGSFLNVVVYRLPRGKSLSIPPSHCPKCKYLIRWYDNIPIFGWLALNGRCRDCKTRISFRYPLVETITALVFGTLTFLVIVLEGAPKRPFAKFLTSTEYWLITEPFSPNADWAIIAYTLVLLMTLFTAGLIEVDKPKLQSRIFLPLLFLPPFLIGLLGSLFFPFLHWIPFYAYDWPIHGIHDWMVRHGEWGHGCWWIGLPDALCGLFALGIAGCITCFLLPLGHRRLWIFSVSLLGLFLGWQAGLLILPVALLLSGWVRVVHHRIVPVLSLTLCALIYVMIAMIRATSR